MQTQRGPAILVRNRISSPDHKRALGSAVHTNAVRTVLLYSRACATVVFAGPEIKQGLAVLLLGFAMGPFAGA